MVIQNIQHCRNGVAGAGYFHLRLTWRADGRKYTGTAIVFDAAEHVAVNADDGTPFRCEDFEAELRAFIDSDAGQQMTWPPHVATAS